MRIVTTLALAGLFALGCSDDTASETVPDETLPVDAGSSTPASTSSSSPTSTTSTSTTTSTTVPDSDPFAEFTTREMEAALVDSHRYVGGWVVSPTFDVAVDQWARGTEAVEDWFVDGGEMEVWVLELIRRSSDGTAVWRRADVVVVEMSAERGFSARCRVDGTAVDGLFATTVVFGDEPWFAAEKAGQVDLDALTVAEVDSGPVDCENEGYGV